MRQGNPDYGRWSIQKIGRKLGAQQVLYIRLDDLEFQMSSDQPITEPRVRLHMKVIGVTESPETARQWPPRKEREGRLVEHTRHAREVSDSVGLDSEVTKFAREVAFRIAMPFYDVDLEEPIPQEH